MHKTYFNWSSGKDSALALYYLLQDKKYSIDLLLTTVNKEFERVSMHGLREELLDKQVENIGLPLKKVLLNGNVSMEEYNVVMQQNLQELKADKYTHTAFGDIFLEDLKKYRENQLEKEVITATFPLWKRNTKELLQEFLALGFKTIVVCVNANLLDESFVGRIIDEQFIKDLPENIDVCGENGEFHTFCYDGPIFKKPVEFEIGEKVLKEYKTDKNECTTDTSEKETKKTWSHSFWYCDLIPK